MNKRILFFNLIYYSVTISLIRLGQNDPSSSLGYGYFILIFWALAGISLILLLKWQKINPKSHVDRVGVFLATPVLSIFIIAAIIRLGGTTSSGGSFDLYFEIDNRRFLKKTFYFDKTTTPERVEYYKFVSNSEVQKDSIWLYFSKSGDTIRKVNYQREYK